MTHGAYVPSLQSLASAEAHRACAVCCEVFIEPPLLLKFILLLIKAHQSDMRVALITGCSSGPGKELARTLHTGGWTTNKATPYRVFAAARSLRDVADLKLEGIEVVQLDVTDPESVAAVVDRIVLIAGRIDLLVCNAGIIKHAPIIEQKIEDIQAVFATNTMGALLCVRAVAPIMIQQRAGTMAVHWQHCCKCHSTFYVLIHSIQGSHSQNL